MGIGRMTSSPRPNQIRALGAQQMEAPKPRLAWLRSHERLGAGRKALRGPNPTTDQGKG